LLARMGFADLRTVDDLAEARCICAAGEADACLVVLPPAIPDEAPRLTADADAPGRGVGVPSLLIADALTPHLIESARSAGYAAVVARRVKQRLLYRRLGGLLQKPRRTWDRLRSAARWERVPNAAGEAGRRRGPPKRKLQ
jgi:hypothetical protein